MDILIPLGGVQNNEYRELRFSLRALDAHMTDIGKLFIAGDIPEWLVGIEHLKISDIEGDAKRSVQEKILSFCKVMDASDDFLFTHDDIFAVEKFSGEELPFYSVHEGEGNLIAPLYFQVHTPIRYNKKMYADLFSYHDIAQIPSPRAFYCNFYKAPATKIVEVVPKYGPEAPLLVDQIKAAPFFSLNDRACGRADFVAALEILYPTPSRWELP